MEHPSIELERNNFLRRLKGATLSVLLALYASARSLGVSDLASLTGWSQDRVRSALHRLQAQGWVEQRGRYHGWALVTEARRRLHAWLQADQPEPACALKARSRSLEVVNNININNKPTTTDSDSPANAEKHHLPPAEDTPASAEKHHLPSVEDILSAAEGLFGEPVWEPPERYRDPQLLLAWIAHAYQMRLRLDKPARVVYRNLQAHRPPPQHYLDDPLAYLPVAFLEAAGFATPAGEAGDLPDGEQDLPPAEAAAASAQEDPSLDLPAGPAKIGPPAAQAWRQALDLLRPGRTGGMPVGAYTRWVAPAALLRYRPPPGPGLPAVFSVQVPTDFLRAVWLDRLVPTLRRHLCGICAGEAEIEVLVQDQAGVQIHLCS